MKLKYFLFCTLLIFSCNTSYQKLENKDYKEKSGNAESASGDTYIVKTIKGFDASQFLNVGGIYDGSAPYENSLIEGVFYTLGRPSLCLEDEFIKNIEAIKGVYYIDKNEEISTNSLIPYDVASPILHPFGLDDGNLEGDPDALYYEYALRITRARDFIDAKGISQKGAYTSVGYGNNNVVIAIIDTGLNMKHPDFTKDGNSICLYAKTNYNSSLNSSGEFEELDDMKELDIGTNEDGSGHGTHCSGTMCAVGENNEGIVGVAYKNTHLISYKGLGIRYGSLESIYKSLADLAEIVTILKKEPSDRTNDEKNKIPKSVPANFKITQKTVPVNMSLGSTSTHQFAIEMLNLAVRNDILPVIAMSNDGRIEPAYPRSFYGCIAVGATDNKDKRANFSDAGEWMSVCAPGVDIVSTYNGFWNDYGPVGVSDTEGVQFMSGTSMATPFVTGMIGYLLSFDEGQKLNGRQIKRLLELTADKIDTKNPHFGKYINGHSLYYGYGRVNVLKAARSITKKEGAFPIPKVDSFYLSQPMKCKTPSEGTIVRLYEFLGEDNYLPQGLAITDQDKTTYFYGLKKDTEYIITCNLDHGEKVHKFKATNTKNMEYEFTN